MPIEHLTDPRKGIGERPKGWKPEDGKLWWRRELEWERLHAVTYAQIREVMRLLVVIRSLRRTEQRKIERQWQNWRRLYRQERGILVREYRRVEARAERARVESAYVLAKLKTVEGAIKRGQMLLTAGEFAAIKRRSEEQIGAPVEPRKVEPSAPWVKAERRRMERMRKRVAMPFRRRQVEKRKEERGYGRQLWWCIYWEARYSAEVENRLNLGLDMEGRVAWLHRMNPMLHGQMGKFRKDYQRRCPCKKGREVRDEEVREHGYEVWPR
jgi:hypothetical protein